MTLERRGFLKNIGAGAVAAGATVVASKAWAAEPVVKWRLGSSFTKALDTMYGASEDVAFKVAEITNDDQVTSADIVKLIASGGPS